MDCRGGNKSRPDPYNWPYVCQLSWLVFDVTKNYTQGLYNSITRRSYYSKGLLGYSRNY